MGVHSRVGNEEGGRFVFVVASSFHCANPCSFDIG